MLAQAVDLTMDLVMALAQEIPYQTDLVTDLTEGLYNDSKGNSYAENRRSNSDK